MSVSWCWSDEERLDMMEVFRDALADEEAEKIKYQYQDTQVEQ